MKSTLLFLALTFIGLSAFAQGAAPFWESLPGPQGPGLNIIFRADSSISQKIGGTVYIYDTASKRWVPRYSDERPVPYKSTAHLLYSIPARQVLPYVYAAYKDTLFYSPDSGLSWQVVGRFGSGRNSHSVQSLIKTPTHVLLVSDSNRLYSSTDNFVTIDTEALPELFSSFDNDADTVYLYTVHGNIYRSIDFGKNWRMTFNMHDTASNWSAVVWRIGSLWFLGSAQLNPLSSNLHLAYSRDKGNNWIQMTTPISDKWPEFEGIDHEGRIYLYFSSAGQTNFRTDDSGQTWHKLSISDPSLLIDRAGTVYSGSLYSTDHGETWDTISSALTACLPSTMISFGDSSVLGTMDSYGVLHSTGNNGQSWNDNYLGLLQSNDPLQLSLRPDSTQWLMLNTTRKINPSGGSRYLCWSSHVETSGIGTITSGFHVWVASARSFWVHRWDPSGKGSWHDTLVSQFALSESTDIGCSYFSGLFDTLSSTPILQVLESAHDTILAVSTSGVYRGFDVFTSPLDTVTPELGSGAMPTGAMMKDSTGAIFIAMSDGKLFATSNGAITWQSVASPETDGAAPIISLAAAPNGILFAVDSNIKSGYTRTWEYDPSKQTWNNITYGLNRSGFPDPAQVTNVWYVNGYAYAGTWNMGLFRSIKSVGALAKVGHANDSSSVSLYPNPTSGSLHVAVGNAAVGRIELLDVLGQSKLVIVPHEHNTSIDLSQLPSGTYFLRVETAKGILFRKIEKE